MKTNLFLLALLLLMSLFTPTVAEQPTATVPKAVTGVSFMLKNTLGYQRMFRVEGPGIAYGFTMGKRETIPCNWPVGSQLYFSKDSETTTSLILTVSASDEGKTLGTDTRLDEAKPTATEVLAQAAVSARKVTVQLRNPSLLPRSITLISYAPGETGNGTTGCMLAPKGTKAFRFPVGTRLYLANSEQVDVVMSGKRIDAGKPFLTVKAEDAGQAFDVK